jgi:hypothetical protein
VVCPRDAAPAAFSKVPYFTRLLKQPPFLQEVSVFRNKNNSLTIFLENSGILQE